MKDITKLSWIINNACNLKCIHCYPDSGYEHKREFAECDFEKLSTNLKNIHFHRVFLSGGEPILDTNFYKYLQIAKSISDEVFVCSNGTLLTDSKLDELTTNGVNGIVLSCQAIDAENSLKIYGNKRVASLIFSAIERILNRNLALSVEISLMKQNIENLDKIIKSLLSINVKSISFKRLLPVGRGDSDKIGLSKEENYRILKSIYEWQINNADIRFNVHDTLYGTILFDHFKEISNDEGLLNWLHGFSCRAGTKWIGIDPQGNVSPCPILLYKDILIGNVLDTPLTKILSDSSLITLFQKIEEHPDNSCKYGSICLGCRATVISKTGNLYGKDPMCVHKNCVCPICNEKRQAE